MACVQRRFRSWELMVRSRACCGVSNHEAPMLFGLILRDAREERAPQDEGRERLMMQHEAGARSRFQ